MSTTHTQDLHQEPDAELPLKGVRVLDLTTALSGPFSTQTLADMGADVIKVERPAGDDSRKWGPPFVDEDAAYFYSVNRNKRSIALDLKDEADREVFDRLAAESDVLVENYRPGVTSRLGISYEDLRVTNPRLIYCSVSGYGATMPPKAGYDQVVQATSGWMSLSGDEGTGPMRTGVPIGDIAAGMNATQSILGALYRRERSGAGGYIDISMQDTLISMLAYHATRYFATGEDARPTGNIHPLLSPYGYFDTGDGGIVMAVGNDSQFANLCRLMGREDLIGSPDFASNSDRKQNQEALFAIINEEFSTITSADLLVKLESFGIPAGAVRKLSEVLTSEDTKQRNAILSVPLSDGSTFQVSGGGWRIDGTTAEVRMPPPKLNEHAEEILGELNIENSRRETPEETA